MHEPQRDRERVKVWRPEGFTGVEVEIFENVQAYFDPKSVLSEHHFNVNFRGGPRVMYAGGRHSLRYTRPLVMVQQPGKVYAAGARGGALTGWNMSINESGMRWVMDALELPGLPPHFPVMTAPEVLNDALAEQLGSTIAAFDLSATRLERETNLLLWLRPLLRAFGKNSSKLGREHRSVAQVKAYLKAHTAQDVRLADLARVTGLHEHYLLRVFKREVGVSPHQYQASLRLAKAKALLGQGLTAAQVALEVGVYDQSGLNRLFKRHLFVTPGQYRKALQYQ